MSFKTNFFANNDRRRQYPYANIQTLFVSQIKEMNSANITSTLMKQASCMQTLSSVCTKRHCLFPICDASMYGKRFVTSSDSNASSNSTDGVNRRVNSSPGSEAKRMKSEPAFESGLPEEPTDCCMSGCANCVWIQYAEELKNKFCSSDQELRQLIMNKISDPNMKMFLSMELDNLSDECKWRPTVDNNVDDKVTK